MSIWTYLLYTSAILNSNLKFSPLPLLYRGNWKLGTGEAIIRKTCLRSCALNHYLALSLRQHIRLQTSLPFKLPLLCKQWISTCYFMSKKAVSEKQKLCTTEMLCAEQKSFPRRIVVSQAQLVYKRKIWCLLLISRCFRWKCTDLTLVSLLTASVAVAT
jgi:hypothetical protein